MLENSKELEGKDKILSPGDLYLSDLITDDGGGEINGVLSMIDDVQSPK
jgi:hypothetical protein